MNGNSITTLPCISQITCFVEGNEHLIQKLQESKYPINVYTKLEYAILTGTDDQLNQIKDHIKGDYSMSPSLVERILFPISGNQSIVQELQEAGYAIQLYPEQDCALLIGTAYLLNQVQDQINGGCRA